MAVGFPLQIGTHTERQRDVGQNLFQVTSRVPWFFHVRQGIRCQSVEEAGGQSCQNEEGGSPWTTISRSGMSSCCHDYLRHPLDPPGMGSRVGPLAVDDRLDWPVL